MRYLRTIERETNGIMKYNFCSFEWSNEYSIDGNIRATDEKLLRITSYGRLNRSIMRYRCTPTSISPWWFVKMESLLSSVYLREHQLPFKPLLPTITISDYHWISANWIFTVTNSLSSSKIIRSNETNKKIFQSINSYYYTIIQNKH